MTVLSEYGGSYSVVCVINIPAQTAPTVTRTSMWRFSVTFLCCCGTAKKITPKPEKGVNLLFSLTLCLYICETITIKYVNFVVCLYLLSIWCDSQAFSTVRFFDFRHFFTPIFSHANRADEGKKNIIDEFHPPLLLLLLWMWQSNTDF